MTRYRYHSRGAILLSTATVALGMLLFSAAASAHVGAYEVFNQCPSTNPSVTTCLYSETVGGSVTLGSQTTPIKNPVIFQGGYGFERTTRTYPFAGAVNGETLTKAPQPVPGGLAGLVKCEEISVELVRDACEAALENGFTGVNATLELAEPATSVIINPRNLLAEEGLALQLLVKVHLENPFLGSNCYIGSSSEPIIWHLTTGVTSPPAPNTSIKGSSGLIGNEEEGEIATLTGTELVDNSYAVPGASGCGPLPLSEYIVDPVVNAKIGLPASAGHNSVRLVNNIKQASAGVVNTH